MLKLEEIFLFEKGQLYRRSYGWVARAIFDWTKSRLHTAFSVSSDSFLC